MNKETSLPIERPHRVSSPFGWRTLNGKRQFHHGIDFVSLTGLNDVLAVADGIVTYDQDDYNHSLRFIAKHHSAGNMIIIKHEIKGAEYYVRYVHLGENYVSKGTEVSKGQLVGVYGDYGYSFGAHLHVDCFNMSWKRVDPTFIWGKRA